MIRLTETGSFPAPQGSNWGEYSSNIHEFHSCLLQRVPNGHEIGRARGGAPLLEAKDGLAVDTGGRRKLIDRPAQRRPRHSALHRQ